MPLTLKHFRSGSTYPEPTPGKLRLYSMHCCPYAQRTKMVLLHKGIDHETVNIHLQDKPEWFLEKITPIGKVPTIQLDDRIVFDSVIVNDYLDAMYPETKLNPDDPYQLASDRMLLEKYGKFIGAFYKVMLSHTEDKEDIENMFSALDGFELDVKKRGTPFLGGDKPKMVDLNVWPHMMRIPHLAYSFNNPEVELSPDRFPAVTSWINNMGKVPAVQQTNLDKDHYKLFIESYIAKKVDYDVFIEE
ncbi:SEPIA-like protein [Mya arenaria]|uniref:Glutathione S-transferase omega n=1 Tax=Mya arenaria TaxID=6604 RepID=A0ABY7ETY0_MYAAR|nr:pyrimidodiazepine synthase-like [Mya arenaria]WAR12156.1 SEPIA-like protein [Mya arenaria]